MEMIPKWSGITQMRKEITQKKGNYPWKMKGNYTNQGGARNSTSLHKWKGIKRPLLGLGY